MHKINIVIFNNCKLSNLKLFEYFSVNLVLLFYKFKRHINGRNSAAYSNKNTVEDDKKRFIIKTVHIKQKIKQTCIKIKIRNLKIKMLQSLQNNKDYCNMEIDCIINEKVIKS